MLSVIVPVYNVARYLEACIDSICRQTYTDLEIILVDDGSTDGCYKICEDYKQKDSRIIVLHKENGGLVSARKAGLSLAEGEFIGWVDGDDWIEEDYFQQMVGIQKASDADLVASGHFHDIGNSGCKVYNHIRSGCYVKEEILPRLIYSGEFFEYGLQPHLWNKIIRRDIMKSVEMRIDDSITIGEDVLAVYPCVMEADIICVTDICSYHYVQHENSMTKAYRKPEELCLKSMLDSLKGMWKDSRPEYRLDFQLLQYEKNYRLLHQYSTLERSEFPPYGNIPAGSRIIIFGAGAMGRSLYQYFAAGKTVKIIAWIDSNWKDYIHSEYAIQSPECIREWKDAYDLILIANTRKKAAVQMKKHLMMLGVNESKIRWLTSDFINNLIVWPKI
ncbi:glycosyltransferase [Lachnospiraceae bacterium 62-26]|jgi:glycosyltransferase involved in cell wall biosynthesis